SREVRGRAGRSAAEPTCARGRPATLGARDGPKQEALVQPRPAGSRPIVSGAPSTGTVVHAATVSLRFVAHCIWGWFTDWFRTTPCLRRTRFTVDRDHGTR